MRVMAAIAVAGVVVFLLLRIWVGISRAARRMNNFIDRPTWTDFEGK